MELFESLNSLADRLQGSAGTCVTVGAFDGLHQGHQALIFRACDAARLHGLKSLVITFQEHPLCTLAPPYCPKRLLDRERKHALLEQFGVDLVADIPFTGDFAGTPPEQFFTGVLMEECRARMIVCGYDFSFGREGAGTVALMQELGARHGVGVEVIEPVADHTIAVKSTMIRDLLISGEVERAARLLTRPFDLHGPVVPGKARGRTLGFPTANVQVPSSRIMPARGVYLCAAEVLPQRDRLHGAMVNVGYSPTFGPGELSVEAHLVGFDGYLVGSELRLHFLRRIRDEQKFSGPEALVAQLEQDRETTLSALASEEIKQLFQHIGSNP